MIPLVSIIIPTLGSKSKLQSLLKSLQQQIVDFDFEVLIIDNSLQTFDKVWLQQMKSNSHFDIQYLRTEKKGVNQARNLGLRTSQSEILLFIDDDCWLRDQYLIAKHVSLHKQNPDLFAAGGYYHLPVGKSLLDICYHMIQMNWLQAGISSDSEQSQYLIGGHFSVKKEKVDQHKINFDENIVYGGSELSFFQKAIKQGLKMTLHTIYIMHDTNESLISLTRKLYRQGVGKSITHQTSNGVNSEGGDTTNEDFKNIKLNLVRAYLNVVFWFGYYQHSKNLSGFIGYLLKSPALLLSEKKRTLLRRIDEALQKKKDRGDLL